MAFHTGFWGFQITKLFIDRGLSPFQEMSVKVPTVVTDLAGWSCDSVSKVGEYWE